MEAVHWAVDSLRFSRTNWLIQDASGNVHLKQQAWSLVVNGYRRWASQPCTERDLFHDLCEDEYARRAYAKTLVLRGVAPGGGQNNIVGTVRLLVCPRKCSDSRLMPLEAMGMLGSAERWERFFVTDCRLPHAFELGRMALADHVTDEAARAQGLHHAVITLLIAGGIGFADVGFGRQDCVVIASQRIQKALNAANVDVQVYDGFDLKPAQNAVFQRYARYWMDDRPQVCRLSVSPKVIADAAAMLDGLFPQARMAA